MRPILLTLAALTVILFSVTIWNLAQEIGKGGGAVTYVNGELKGFETTTEIPGLKDLKILYTQKIKEYNASAGKNRSAWIWVSFLVTVLTAASTLVSSIQAAKGNTSSNQRSLILVAIFTFLASLGNWGAGHLNENRNLAIQKAFKLSEHRINFYSAFQRATSDDQKAEIVQQYQNELETM